MERPQQQQQPRKRRHGPREIEGAKGGDGSAKLKRKVRDLERLLRRPKPLDEAKKIEIERALTAYKSELDDLMNGRKEQEIAKKYHMIRFFERQKASRKVKQARKLVEMADSRSKRKDAEQLVKQYTVDLAYTIHFPQGQKYVSLYPKENIEEETSSKIRSEFRAEFAQAIKSGEIVIDLQSADNTASSKKPKASGKQNAQKRAAAAGADEDVVEDAEEDEFLAQAPEEESVKAVKKAKKEESTEESEDDSEESEEGSDSDSDEDEDDRP